MQSYLFMMQSSNNLNHILKTEAIEKKKRRSRKLTLWTLSTKKIVFWFFGSIDRHTCSIRMTIDFFETFFGLTFFGGTKRLILFFSCLKICIGNLQFQNSQDRFLSKIPFYFVLWTLKPFRDVFILFLLWGRIMKLVDFPMPNNKISIIIESWFM